MHVQLTTQDISKAIVITNSVLVAKEFGKRHDHVLRDVKELIEGLKQDEKDGLKIEPISGEKDAPNFGAISEGGQLKIEQSSNSLYHIEETSYLDAYGRSKPMYNMNREFFMLLVMGYSGDKARKLKTAFIAQFKRMEHELLVRSETRVLGKAVRKEISDAINSFVSNEGNFKKFAYSNYTKLIYKKALGMDVKTAKERFGCPEDGKLRDYLSVSDLDKVAKLEEKVATFLEFTPSLGKTDKEMYQLVKSVLEK